MNPAKILLQVIIAFSILYFFTVHIKDRAVINGLELSFIYPLMVFVLAIVALKFVKNRK